MRNYLVVANQTLLSEQLMQELLLRAETEDSSFYFIVPDTAKHDYSQEWAVSGRGNGSSGSPGARQRLSRALTEIRAAGAAAQGSVERADPVDAIELRVRREDYDEIIVSTLPKTLSRWLKMDLPSKVERAVTVPVTTIIAKDL